LYDAARRHDTMNSERSSPLTGSIGILGIVVAASIAAIPLEARAGDKEEAKELFKEGIEAYKNENFEEALEAFLASDELYHHPDTLVNIANSYAELYNFPKAMEYFERYLDEKGDDLTPDQKKDIRNKMKRVGKKVGKLVIEPEDLEGELLIDGEEMGDLPLEDPLYLEAGLHRVTVQQDGETVFKEEIEIAGATRTELEVEPEEVVEEEVVEETAEKPEEEKKEKKKKEKKKKGAMRVEVEGGETATVWVDGKKMGETPWEDQFREGSYSVKVEAPGKPTWTGGVTVESARHTELTVDLDSTKKVPDVDNPLFWAMIGATVPSLAAGVALTILAGQVNDVADQLRQELEAGLYDPFGEGIKDRMIGLQHDLVDRGQNQMNAAIVMYVLSGVFAATAVASIFIFRKQKPAATGSFEISGVSPLLSPGTGLTGIGLHATF
jgi:hypothetical protein